MSRIADPRRRLQALLLVVVVGGLLVRAERAVAP
jgi:hypothetical protein